MTYFILFALKAIGQEYVAPLDHNLAKYEEIRQTQRVYKTTVITLPFFEDFTDPSIFPDATKWLDHDVYINNTMAVNPISRGVATFDALNEKSGPYDSSNANSLEYADSLTSQPFDLSIYQPADSLYISFYYQPQGNGFAPESQDSFLLYFKSNNGWQYAWGIQGSSTHSFKQIMIAVNDPMYFHSNFQFRFMNKASMNVNDDVWNLDYIRFAANRTINDTAVNDVATTIQPTNILNDYTSMPYRHFATNISGELAAQHSFNVKNNNFSTQSITTGYQATEITTSTNLFSSITTNGNIIPYATQQYQYPMYSVSFVPSNPYNKVIFENKYFATNSASEPKQNDTITHHQIFDNYLAYDDGTAEKSYFLKQSPTLPAKLAIEHHLNQADTIRGVAIYFGRQVPLAFGKFFTAQIYQDIAVNGGTDDLIFEQQLLFPAYTDTVNKFWVYRFDEAVAMPTGVFFISIMQPAASGSDSLYYGLDVNRIGGNHAYFNVLNVWESSTVSGAVMIRPILGQDIIGTNIPKTKNAYSDWKIFPNPVTDVLNIQIEKATALQYEIIDLQGRKILAGTLPDTRNISITNLLPGMYFIRIFNDKGQNSQQRFIKL